jgi:hypothetical protein
MLKKALLLALISVLASCGDKKTVGSSTEPPVTECGNNVRRDTEQCDGTDVAGQSCTSVGYDSGTLTCAASCTFDTAACVGTGPVCGDNVATGLEQCDGTDLVSATCRTLGYDGGTLLCAAGCAFDVAGCTGSGPACGNNNAEGLEDCDGIDLSQMDCQALGFDGGILSCDASCRFVTSSCTGTAPFCGDGNAQGLEQCDGNDVNGLGCADLGYTSGPLGCRSDCLFDASACVGTPAICGDNVANGLEECDGTDLNGAACTDLGYAGGTLACDNSCTFDARGCTQPVCPNGVREPGEACDGTDLGGDTCADVGLGTGALACTATCTLDTTGCATPVCGDGIVNGATEECDGMDLGGTRCNDLTFQRGMLLCDSNCRFDTLLCTGTTATCGDGVKAISEPCEGTDFGTATCATEGFTDGTLTCTNCRIGTSTCTGTGPVCPNGIAEGSEQCDGADLKGRSCTSFGFNGGTLACSNNCTYNPTGCTYTPPCGNNVAQWPEPCDGTDLRGETCASLNAGTGTLACNGTCDSFVLTGCSSAPGCGNNQIEWTEVCDGTDLNGETCASLNAGTGDLGCSGTCDDFIFTGCSAPPVCGDDQIQGLEFCDGTDLGGAASCNDFGYNDTTSAVACLPTCGAVDLSACTGAAPRCADTRHIWGRGQCDGTDLKNQTCETLGYASGTLSCNANCSFNVSACAL